MLGKGGAKHAKPKFLYELNNQNKSDRRKLSDKIRFRAFCHFEVLMFLLINM